MSTQPAITGRQLPNRFAGNASAHNYSTYDYACCCFGMIPFLFLSNATAHYECLFFAALMRLMKRKGSGGCSTTASCTPTASYELLRSTASRESQYSRNQTSLPEKNLRLTTGTDLRERRRLTHGCYNKETTNCTAKSSKVYSTLF